MFKCKGCEARKEEILLLRTLLSDMEGRISSAELAYREERKNLLEKIMALSNPGALVVARRPEVVMKAPEAVSHPPRPHYPGYRPDLRPEKIEDIGLKGKITSDYKTQSTLSEVATKKN